MSTERPDERADDTTDDITDDTTADTTIAPETSTMSQHDSTSGTPEFDDPLAAPTGDPLADPVAPPVGDPGDTTALPAASTQALPSPFRVEPSAPVPDDVVTDAAQLPHLPPPPQPDPSWPAPAGSQQWHQQDPRPALVTVRKGPRPGSIMFGLLTMIVAAYLLVANLTDAELTFRLVGPPMIGAFGGMLLLVGLAGVVAGRVRR